MYKKEIKNKKSGFIALMSVLIIAITLLGISFTRSNNGFFSRFGVLESEYKRVGLGLAESCVNVALLKISQNYTYAPAGSGETISVNPSATPPTECIIKSVAYDTTYEATLHQKVATIATQANYKGTWSNMKISATIQNPNYTMIVRGTVTVVTHVVNDNGGTKSAGNFNITASPSTLSPSPATSSGSETGTTVYLNAGSYNVNAASMSGYNQSASSNCSGTIAPGESKVCTITENDIPTTGTLTLVAEVKNDNGGTKQPSDFPLFIDSTSISSGVPKNGLSVGSHTATKTNVAGYTASSWGFHCTSSGAVSLNAGDNKTCIITFDDDAPVAPVCAETVMMLDRTGSMGSTDLSNEKSAANALVSLYSTVSPLPKVGVGVFGDGSDNNGLAPSKIVGQLTTTYSTLTAAINTWLAGSEGYTNLSDAINKGSGELNSARHVAGKAQVLIMVSDGDTNRPEGTIIGSTPLMLPTTNAQNGSGDSWTNPIGAQANGGTDASNSTGNRERYSTFGLNVPGSATITGIEVQADSWSAWSGGGPVATTLLADNFGTGGTDTTFDEAPGWTETGSTEKRAAGSGADSASPDGGRFAVVQNGSSICKSINASGVTALKVQYFWRGDPDANDTGDDGIVEYKTGGNCGDTNGWTQLQNHDLQNDAAWSAQAQFSLPTALNNSTFFIRFRANSEVNEYFRVDDVDIVGTTTAVSSGCQLGIDLSWNGGASWSTEKTQNLTAAESAYTLGNSTDKWGTHNWLPTELSGTNFVARVRDIDPGASCQDAATTHLDALQAKVHYSMTNDPFELALDAADTAKSAGTQIFTIHFGDDPSGYPGKDFLANLANGSSAVTYNGSTHQNGSTNNLSGTAATGDTGFRSPTATTTPNQWSNPGNAYGSDNSYATDLTNANKEGYGKFGLAVPSGATITGIAVSVEAKSTDASGCQVGVEVSSNNGGSYTGSSSNRFSITSTSDNTYTIGNSSSLWGRSWTPGDFADGKFSVRLEDLKSSGCTGSSTLSVDRVQTRVYYSSVPENTDNDNFFVSPTSADMRNIFETIGQKVCPALSVITPPPPTTANLIIITNVVNDNGGIKQASDFTSLISAQNPVPAGSQSGVASPGLNITVNPGSYSIDQSAFSGYTKTLGVSCSGNIAAGETKTCTINNDDVQPASAAPITPPPLSNIIIGSWREI